MKAYGGATLLHIVFNLDTRSASRLGRFIFSENAACIHWLRDGAGLRPGHKATEKRKYRSLLGTEFRLPSSTQSNLVIIWIVLPSPCLSNSSSSP